MTDKANARKSDAVDNGSTGTTKRRKVNHACLYCRRSHMHCDENRPCQRCIKRDIGHLCHDEVKPAAPSKQHATTGAGTNGGSSNEVSLGSGPAALAGAGQAFPASFMSLTSLPNVGPVPAMKIDSMGVYNAGAGSTPFITGAAGIAGPGAGVNPTAPWPLISPDPTSIFQTEAPGGTSGEFAILSDFLENLDNHNAWFNASSPSVTNPTGSLLSSTATPLTINTQQPQQPQQTGSTTLSASTPVFGLSTADSLSQGKPTPQSLMTLTSALSPSSQQTSPQLQMQQSPQKTPTQQHPQPHHEHEHVDPLPPSTKTERFLLTAADQESGTRDERLKSVIRAKYEAGLLKPYNYVKGYARLSRWMERNCSPESRQAILQPISVLRPKFRGIAQSLKDLDLVYVEEAFERLLLDYDRVFSAMGIPACLWRRTGEIYKANKSFADLVGIDVGKLKDGRLCIYELMSESSAVNYWEKYGHVAFDAKQKAVLTSCVLRFKPNLPALQPGAIPSGGATPSQLKAASRRRAAGAEGTDGEEVYINCCFSFTIRRDFWGIPSMIVGNFIKC